MNVVILTECNNDTGFGHLTRCISISDGFEEIGIQPVFIVNGDQNAANILTGKNFTILNWISEQEKLFHLIKETDVLIIDSYLSDLKIYETLATHCDFIVCVDDTNRLDYPAQIVINSGIGAEDLKYYTSETDKIFLLGSSFHPVRKEFWKMPGKKINDKAEVILILFGGSDIRNISSSLEDFIVKKFPERNFRFITGSGNNQTDENKDSSFGQIRRLTRLNSREIMNEMLLADIAVSGAGQSLFELAATGTPTIAIGLADNQKNNLKGWQESKFIDEILWWDDPDLFQKLYCAINNLSHKTERENKSRIGKNLIDTKGSRRIVKNLMKIYLDNYFELRRAGISDITDVYQLSNDPVVRSNSINLEPILYENHVKWYQEKSKGKDCYFLIGKVKSQFVGQIRFNIQEKNSILSISILDSYRGLGIGKRMVNTALKMLKNKFPLVQEVNAFVKTHNKGSKLLFENTGFVLNEANEPTEMLHYIFKY